MLISLLKDGVLSVGFLSKFPKLLTLIDLMSSAAIRLFPSSTCFRILSRTPLFKITVQLSAFCQSFEVLLELLFLRLEFCSFELFFEMPDSF